MDKRFFRLDLWASLLVLVWFFIPGRYLGWAKDKTGTGEEIYLSGFELMMNFGLGGMVFAVIPLSCAFVVICALYGANAFLPFAQKGVLVGVGLFVLMSLMNSVLPGFYVTLGIGLYLWWESSRKPK